MELQDLFHRKLYTKSCYISYSLGVHCVPNIVEADTLLSCSFLHFKSISLKLSTSFIAADASS